MYKAKRELKFGTNITAETPSAQDYGVRKEIRDRAKRKLARIIEPTHVKLKKIQLICLIHRIDLGRKEEIVAKFALC